jgi:nucleotide-binding universal stress UspA family protein
MQIATILLSTDLSDASWTALEPALFMAKSFNARVVILHVLPPAHTAIGGFDAAIVPLDLEQISENRRTEAEAAIRAKLASSTREVEVRVTEALNPAREIAEQAKELGADLLVMATHGRTGLSHILHGSTAETVVRISTVPVLSVRAFPRKDVPEDAAATRAARS